MRSKLTIAAALVAAMAVPALAGLKATAPVIIWLPTRTAHGALGSARNAADSVQYIGCKVIAFSDGSWQTTCEARDSSGATVSCVNLVNPQIRDAARSLQGDSHLLFTWDAGGSCAQLTVTNDSRYEPKV